MSRSKPKPPRKCLHRGQLVTIRPIVLDGWTILTEYLGFGARGGIHNWLRKGSGSELDLTDAQIDDLVERVLNYQEIEIGQRMANEPEEDIDA